MVLLHEPQVNRPFSKPLVLLTPKSLHLHRHATSALHDFGPQTFFNRVIDDGKVGLLHPARSSVRLCQALS